jgi:hypothetical protein
MDASDDEGDAADHETDSDDDEDDASFIRSRARAGFMTDSQRMAITTISTSSLRRNPK